MLVQCTSNAIFIRSYLFLPMRVCSLLLLSLIFALEINAQDSLTDALSATDTNRALAVKDTQDTVRPMQDTTVAPSQATAQSLQARTMDSSAVIWEGDTLFFLYGNLGAYNAEERALHLQHQIEGMVLNPEFHPDSIRIVGSETSYSLRWSKIILFTVTTGDARGNGMDQAATAQVYLQRLQAKIPNGKAELGWQKALFRVLLLLLSLGGLWLGMWLLNRGHRVAQAWLKAHSSQWLKGVRFKHIEVVSARRMQEVFSWLLGGIRWLFLLLLLYVSLPVIFSIFPATQGYSDRLFDALLSPLTNIWAGIIHYLPKFISLVIILVLAHYLLRLLKFLTDEVEKENLVIPGFYTEWARPTYSIARFVVFAFALILVFPYLPGSNSPIFVGIAIFLGLVLVVAAAPSVSNWVAGLFLTYMRPFRTGDEVSIGAQRGKVLAKNRLATRLQTSSGAEVLIPNSLILKEHTVNYTHKRGEEHVVCWPIVFHRDLDGAQALEMLRKTMLQETVTDLQLKWVATRGQEQHFLLELTLNETDSSEVDTIQLVDRVHRTFSSDLLLSFG